jgi:hypothetical protein
MGIEPTSEAWEDLERSVSSARQSVREVLRRCSNLGRTSCIADVFRTVLRSIVPAHPHANPSLHSISIGPASAARAASSTSFYRKRTSPGSPQFVFGFAWLPGFTKHLLSSTAPGPSGNQTISCSWHVPGCVLAPAKSPLVLMHIDDENLCPK